jgi:hypothetical protein
MVDPMRAALQEVQVTLEVDEFDATQASRSFTVGRGQH